MTRVLTEDDVISLGFGGLSDVQETFDNMDHSSLRLVGSGGSALVFAHPDESDLVIRVSVESDGWVLHALGGEPSDFRPTVHAAAHLPCGVWFCVVERLENFPSRKFPGVCHEIEMMIGDDPGKHANTRAEREFPGVAEFMSKMAFADDVCERNLMMRGEALVISDPISEMGYHDLIRLRNVYEIDAPRFEPDAETSLELVL